MKKNAYSRVDDLVDHTYCGITNKVAGVVPIAVVWIVYKSSVSIHNDCSMESGVDHGIEPHVKP